MFAFRRALLALVLFGISFGYVEASVVVYLRVLYDPLRLKLHPGRGPGELFPLITPAQLAAAGGEHTRLLLVELGREFSTLVMLAAAALAVAVNFRQWLAAFALAFGVWDLAFYGFLKVAIGWPASLFTWDILFLLPMPWVGPVIAPSIVALTMIAAGVASLARENVAKPVVVRPLEWAGFLLGALVIIVAFMWDWRNTSAGNWPNPFNWPLFWTGELIGCAVFLNCWRRAVR